MSLRVSWSSLARFLALASCVGGGACADDAVANSGPPVLHPVSVYTYEDTAVEFDVLRDAFDPAGNALRVTTASSPGHVVDIVSPGSLRVTPHVDFNGSLTVSYAVSDGLFTSAGIATVIVRPVNDAPVAADGVLEVHRSALIQLAGSDVDQDGLTYEIVTPPAHGALAGVAPSLNYTSVLGFSGEDSFTYRASDGKAGSNVATMRLEVGPGAAPWAFDNFYIGTEDQALQLALNVGTSYGDPLTFTIVTSPRHGALSGTPPNLVFTPTPNFNGTDSFQFSVSDGVQTSRTATVSFTLSPVPDTPVADPQTVNATEDTPIAITLTGSDVDGTNLSLFPRTNPVHGMLTSLGSPGRYTYTPAANYHGPDSFTFIAFDSQLSSAPATVTIEVASVEDPPVAGAISGSLNEDTPTVITLQGSDGDGDPISYAIATPPAHGTLSGTAPALTYSPATDYNGADSFTYTVSSNGATSSPGTVTLQVMAVNDAPIAVSSAVTTAEDTPVAITLNASDVDNPTLTYTIVTAPADGTLTGGTGAVRTYTPAPNATGTRSLTFRASDGALSSTATVTITITPVNDPPTTRDDFVMTDPGTPITFSVTANDFDVEGDPVTLDTVAAPAHGSVEIVDGQLLYTPDPGFLGTDVFVYTVVDGHGASSTASAHVGVGTFPPGAPAEAIATVASTLSTADTQLAPATSSDGRYIAFASGVPLVGDDTNGRTDIYLFDRRTHALTRVSVSSAGDQGDGASQRPQLSGDGRYIVFESFATNLVAGDSNGAMDVFRHDRVTGETVRVSVATGGAQGTGISRDAKISDDGSLVAFTSSAFDLVADDANGVSDVFLRDLAAGTTTRLSVSFTGSDADLASAEPALSGDGRFVAFSSQATNLVVGDTNNVSDVFVRDRLAGTTTRVSVSTTGGEANAASTGPSVSRDGRVVSFLSTATNLVSGAPVQAQLYTRDIQAQTTSRPANMATAVLWGRLSGDGRYVTEFGSSGVAIRDRIAGTGVTVSTSLSLFWPVLSGNGRYLVLLDSTAAGGVAVTVTPNPL